MAILTTCDLPSRNDAIHLNKQAWTSKNLSLSSKIHMMVHKVELPF